MDNKNLINKGSFPMSDTPAPTILPKETNILKPIESIVKTAPIASPAQSTSSTSADNLIEKVMIFYKNGTVKSYQYQE